MSFKWGTRGFPLCVVQTRLAPLVLCRDLLPHHGPIPLPNLKMKVRTSLLPTQHRHIQDTKEQTLWAHSLCRARVRGQRSPLQVSSEVKGQSSDPSATNSPDPVYTTVTKKTVKQEDPFGLSPFTAEERQHPSPKQPPVVSQSPPQPRPPQSQPATTRAAPPSHLGHALDLFEAQPVHPAVTKQTPRGDQQGVQYHSSSPWQQGADCFGALPFVSMATKDN